MSDTAASRKRISVVVPTHRRPELLRALLGSLEEQELAGESFEVIVVPTAGDPGIAVVEEVRARGKLDLRCEPLADDPTRGRSAAVKRNHGVSVARGEWIAFTDDDCRADRRWLLAASRLFERPGVTAIEGRKVIPLTGRPTLTWKGLRSFEKAGGYQTCNMLYRRATFLEAGGFDPRFPFYLEDSDLAWTLLDRGLEIPFAPDARIEHPVGEAEPLRLLDDARRVVLLPLLFRKHPSRYRMSHMRALRLSHLAHLAAQAGALAVLALDPGHALLAAVGLALVVLLDATRLFYGCRASVRERLLTTVLLPIVPGVRLVQLLRGNLRYRVVLLR